MFNPIKQLVFEKRVGEAVNTIIPFLFVPFSPQIQTEDSPVISPRTFRESCDIAVPLEYLEIGREFKRTLGTLENWMQADEAQIEIGSLGTVRMPLLSVKRCLNDDVEMIWPFGKGFLRFFLPQHALTGEAPAVPQYHVD